MSLAVTMVKIHDQQQRILSPQTGNNRDYPVISSGTTTEIHGADLINKWVRVIKLQSSRTSVSRGKK
jgi:hypothetical protein